MKVQSGMKIYPHIFFNFPLRPLCGGKKYPMANGKGALSMLRRRRNSLLLSGINPSVIQEKIILGTGRESAVHNVPLLDFVCSCGSRSR
jgi:hypothetical protein